MKSGLLSLAGRAKATSVGVKAAGVGLFAVICLVVSAGFAGGAASGSSGGAAECQVAPGSTEIPADYFPWLTEAAAKYHLGPRGASIIAAIHWRETEWDQSTLPGVAPGTQNSAGAEGPGQFLVSSWEEYGVDANGDGVKDVYSVPDSVFGTANLLHADGAPQDWRDAIYGYNHAWWYVDEVVEKAAELKNGLVCESGVAELGVGPPRSLERVESVAKWIESRKIHYCWGGGHDSKPGPSTGSGEYCPPGTKGLDCSGSVRWLLVLSGFPDPGPISSGQFPEHYLAGPGSVVTIWSSPSHVFLEIHGRDWTTSMYNFAHGPAFQEHTTEGFVSTHPPGL